MVNKIDHKSAFSWWVAFALQIRNRIVFKLQDKYWRATHKFGVEVTSYVKRAYKIDNETGTDFWRESIAKEIVRVKVAYVENRDMPDGIRGEEAKVCIGFQEVTHHLIIDVRMDFSRKAQVVAKWKITDAPSRLTYSYFVSMDSVHLAFLVSKLNDLYIIACDLGDAYLNIP